MARINVYLPDDLADRAREADLNVSALTQHAIRRALSARELDRWLDEIETLDATEIGHADAMAALDAARDEFGIPDD